MTGMLLDPPCALLTALFLSACVWHASALGAPADWAHVWAQTCQLALVWWGLVLVSFLPAFVRVDKRKWLWPWKKVDGVDAGVKRAQGGPPRNSWPREFRMAVPAGFKWDDE